MDTYRYCIILNAKNNVLLNGLILENSIRNCVYITSSANVTIEYCIIRNNNIAGTYTAPCAVKSIGENTTVNKCVFYNNKGSDADGQALHIGNKGALVVNSLFIGNDGPAISNGNNDRTATTKIISCTIYGNASQNNSMPGGITSVFGGIEVRGSILYGNTTNRLFGTQIDSATDISYCCIQGCSTDSGGVYRKTGNYDAVTTLDVDPNFNGTSVPTDIHTWYSTDNTSAPFKPRSTAITHKATFTNNRPETDVRDVVRISPFDYGAYEVP